MLEEITTYVILNIFNFVSVVDIISLTKVCKGLRQYKKYVVAFLKKKLPAKMLILVPYSNVVFGKSLYNYMHNNCCNIINSLNTLETMKFEDGNSINAMKFEDGNSINAMKFEEENSLETMKSIEENTLVAMKSENSLFKKVKNYFSYYNKKIGYLNLKSVVDLDNDDKALIKQLKEFLKGYFMVDEQVYNKFQLFNTKINLSDLSNELHTLYIMYNTNKFKNNILDISNVTYDFQKLKFDYFHLEDTKVICCDLTQCRGLISKLYYIEELIEWTNSGICVVGDFDKMIDKYYQKIKSLHDLKKFDFSFVAYDLTVFTNDIKQYHNYKYTHSLNNVLLNILYKMLKIYNFKNKQTKKDFNNVNNFINNYMIDDLNNADNKQEVVTYFEKLHEFCSEYNIYKSTNESINKKVLDNSVYLFHPVIVAHNIDTINDFLLFYECYH